MLNLVKSLQEKNLGSLKSHMYNRYLGNKQKIRYLVSLYEHQVHKRGMENVCENKETELAPAYC